MLRNKDIKPFKNRVYLASPTMHGEEFLFVKEAFDTNWLSTVGKNIDEVEKLASSQANKKHAVALCNCTSALHLAIRLAGQKLYGKAKTSHGSLEGKIVFCSDMTFAATVNPVTYEGGIPVFIDSDPNTWNMDVKSLEKAFEKYPDTKLVVMAELYGFLGEVDKIKKICEKHNALLIEDAAEAMGAYLNDQPCGSFGDMSTISFNGNKLITGSSGGCFLTDNEEDAKLIRKWSTQAREQSYWYQHEDVGYNYRMSNVIAGIVRGQYPHVNEHIAKKKEIYERYIEGLKDLPVSFNPILDNTKPNYWLSCILIDSSSMCKQSRIDTKTSYISESHKSCPDEIYDVLQSINVESRPIWKPLHLQPIYKDNDFISANSFDASLDIFTRGLCLPSDIKMTKEEQDIIIDVIRKCFD